MSAHAVWILAERLSREHIAQFYSSERVLIESLVMFTRHGLTGGDAVILVMTPSHRDLLLRRLKADALDVSALQRGGQLLLVDAATLLDSFMRAGMPEPTLFTSRIGEVIESVKPKGSNRQVRIFGEMVDLLWKGNPPAAIRIEELWNDLIDVYDVSLFCAYSTTADAGVPQTLCALHSHVIPVAIVESSADAIVGRTLDQKIVSWNRGAERLYGYTPDEAIGQSTAILIPDEHEDEIPWLIERIRDGEHVDHYETKRRRKDGTVIDVSVSVSPIKTRQGEIVGASFVARDITERKQAEAGRLQTARMEESQAARRLLLDRVFQTQEEERRRIGRELHDQAGQLMASLLVGLRLLEDANTLAAAKAQAQRLRGITLQAMDEVGRLARGLHPAILDDHGLGEALRRYVADYENIHGIAVDLVLNEQDTAGLSQPVQLGVYRILQEALTNVAKHSGAKTVSIRFTRSATALQATLTDDGCGFESDSNAVASSHLGLHSIRERATMLGGTVSFSSDSTGTTILLDIPPEQRIWERRRDSDK